MTSRDVKSRKDQAIEPRDNDNQKDDQTPGSAKR